MNSSRTPRVAGDFAGFVGAGVRLLLYIAATQCYHPGRKRPDPEKKNRNKKGRISIYKSLRESSVTLLGGHQAPLTYELPLRDTEGILQPYGAALQRMQVCMVGPEEP